MNNIEYNTANFEDAYNEMKNIAGNYGSVIKSISGISRIPSGFKRAGDLKAIISKLLGETAQKITSFNDQFSSWNKEIGNIIDIENDILSKLDNMDETISGINWLDYVEYEGGYKRYESTDEYGYPCYIYVPAGYNSSKKFPMITYLAGSGECTSINRVNNAGISKLLSEGLELNAIVYVPSCKSNWSGQSANLITSIDKVANEYNVDKSRISLMGYSSGAFEGFRLVAANPNYFSTFVPIAGHNITSKVVNGLSNSGTSVIMFSGVSDETVRFGEVERCYNKLKEAGVNISLYGVEGVGHSIGHTVISPELLNDMTSAVLGENYPMPENTVKVSKNDFLASVITTENLQTGNYSNLVPSYQSVIANPKESVISNIGLPAQTPSTNGTPSTVASPSTDESNPSTTDTTPINNDKPSVEETPNTTNSPNEKETPKDSSDSSQKADNNGSSNTPVYESTPVHSNNNTPNNSTVTVLPINEFTSLLPVTTGNYIIYSNSSSNFSYQLLNITIEDYNEYIVDLFMKGFLLSEDGSYKYNNYKLNLQYLGNSLSVNVTKI